MSLKKLKRRLSWTFRPGSRQPSVDESLSELADKLTIKENGGIEENGRKIIVHNFDSYSLN